VIRCTGENGAEMTFSEPPPSVIQAQIDRGQLTVVSRGPDREPESPQEPQEPTGVSMPSREDSSAAWHEYALAQGMGRRQAHNMSKASLIEHYTGLRAVS
jgi:hypothetical protein